MPTAQDVIRIAESQVGYSRWTDPQAGTKYGRWYAELTGESYYASSGVPYCAMFVSWVFDQAKVECAGLPGAYCPAMLQDALDDGATVRIVNAEAGDIVYFDWGHDGESDHVGIVVANRGTYLETIEGNTSDTSSGSQTNGGVVARKTRSLANICGIVRPYYGSESVGGTTGAKLDVDGVIGRLSVSEWQRQLGVTVDGIVSGQLSDCKSAYPALVAVEFGGTGSDLMRKVQQTVFVPNPTGIIASGTICMLQGWLVLHGYSCAGDRAGIMGEITAKALQRSLNDEAWN